jgi:hypothetical protein
MPDYSKLHELVSHRVVLEYDTGARIVGYLAQCRPGTGPVQLVRLEKATIQDASGKVLDTYSELTLCPNVLTGLHLEEGPAGRNIGQDR